MNARLRIGAIVAGCAAVLAAAVVYGGAVEIQWDRQDPAGGVLTGIRSRKAGDPAAAPDFQGVPALPVDFRGYPGRDWDRGRGRGPGRGGYAVVPCYSEGGRYQSCYTGFRQIYDVRVHQISRSSCYGNWGIDEGGYEAVIWVDNGCRADFYVQGW